MGLERGGIWCSFSQNKTEAGKEEDIRRTPRSVSRSGRDLDVRVCQTAKIPESAGEVFLEPDLGIGHLSVLL